MSVLLVAACSERTNLEPRRFSEGGQPEVLTSEELLDPQACVSCHPGHYAEWAGSMHAYASIDPVFRAMNERGQQATGGRLGTFCVNCHAPVAVALGLTTDGLDLENLSPRYQGVTCYFCHSVDAVFGEHNNPLKLADDGALRGPFEDPVVTSAHTSRFSGFLDSGHADSARLCGACHDVVVDAHRFGMAPEPTPVALERTYLEWQETLFNARPSEGGLTCNGCHMPLSSTRSTSANVANAPPRPSRRHDFEGVDLALEPFAGAERQRTLVQQFLDSSLLAEICVSRAGVLEITLENSAGHDWPSGATFDRLGWLAVQAYRGGAVVFETLDPEISARNELDGGASGVASSDAGGSSAGIGDADAVRPRDSVRGVTPTLTHRASRHDGTPARFFWEVTAVDDQASLPGTSTRDPLSPLFHRERRSWRLDTRQPSFESIDEVRLTVNLRPIKLEVLNELVASGHLDEQVAARMPTFALLPQRCHTRQEVSHSPDILRGANTDCDPAAPEHSTTLTWRRDDAVASNRNSRQTVVQGAPASCVAHPTYLPTENP